MELYITERALNKIFETAQKEQVDLDETLLRIAVVPGGCSGLTYELGWDTTIQDGDQVREVEGVRVIMDRRSHVYVNGSELDFSEGLDGQGFHFMNPQAVRNCACGESFGL
jgi:iron-sulfur cluster assembly protein